MHADRRTGRARAEIGSEHRPGGVGDVRPGRDARIDHARLRILLGIGLAGPGLRGASVESEHDERAGESGARYDGTSPPRKVNEQTSR